MSVATRQVWAFEAIGTRWEILTDRPLDDATRAAVTALIDEFDLDWSRFRPDSLVSRLARAGGEVACVASFHGILETGRPATAATPIAARLLISHGEDHAQDGQFRFPEVVPGDAPRPA